MKEAKNHHKTARCIISGIALFLCTLIMHAQTVAVPDGYATQKGGTTGGGSATPDTVTTASEFKSAVGNDNPATLNINSDVTVTANFSQVPAQISNQSGCSTILADQS